MSNQGEEQTDELKELVDQVEKREDSSQTTKTSYLNEETAEIAATKEIDILNLPPRNEVHRNKSKHIHIKISAPLIRLLTVILIILVVLGGLYYGWETGVLDFSYPEHALENTL